MRKWTSNHSSLLDGISPDDHGLACSRELEPEEGLNVLGLTWNPALDVFQFKISPPSSPPNTKRSILSTIAKFFDPMGWVSPVTVTAKMFIQHLWKLKLD